MSQGKSGLSISRSDRVTRYNSLRRKLDDLVLVSSDLTPDSATKANGIWREVNKIPVQGADSDEMLLAIGLNETVANFFQDSLPQLQMAGGFTLDDFVAKLKDNVDRSGWNEALEPFNFLRSSISFQTLNQRRAPRIVDDPNKEKKPQKRRINDVPVEATQPTQVDSGSQGERKNVHADLVDRTLKKAYHLTKAPIEFWSFVTDPNSFENTLENMFSVNILVNNNKFKIYTDKEGNKFLEPVTSNHEKGPKKQMFLSISVDHYVEQMKRLDITTPMIKRSCKANNQRNSDSD